jgi:lysozyme
MNRSLLIAELRRDEGVRYVVYLDSRGIPTIGVGHNCRAKPLPLDWRPPLNDIQVDQLLDNDLADTFAGLDKSIPWWQSLDDVRQRVIANMAFNLGVDGLLGFKNTLGAIRISDYAAGADGMAESLWYRQVGARAVRLVQAMRTGVMPA